MPPRHPSLFIAVRAYLTSLAAEGSLAHHPLRTALTYLRDKFFLGHSQLLSHAPSSGDVIGDGP